MPDPVPVGTATDPLVSTTVTTVTSAPATTNSPEPVVASIRIEVVKFRPLGSAMTTTVTMMLEKSAPSVTLTGNYFIRVKKRDTSNPSEAEAVKIRFLLDTREHLLLGIAFSRRDFRGPSNVGQQDFPSWTIETDGTDRAMTILNTRKTTASYDYLIIIQSVGTGEIGVIDPEIENES